MPNQENSRPTDFRDCKYCGDTLEYAPEVNKLVKVCPVCEKAMFSQAGGGKKKKPTYNLG